MRKLFLIIVLLFLSINCWAKPDEEVVKAMTKVTSLTPEMIRKDYNSCSGNTYQMKVCSSYRWNVEDVRLNKIYRDVRDEAKKTEYEKSLINSQHSWLVYRDFACAFKGEILGGGGSIEGLFVLSCKESLTKQRADSLGKILEYIKDE